MDKQAASDLHQINNRGRWLVGGLVLLVTGLVLRAVAEIHSGSVAVFEWFKACPNTDNDDCNGANSATAWKIAALHWNPTVASVFVDFAGTNAQGATTIVKLMEMQKICRRGQLCGHLHWGPPGDPSNAAASGQRIYEAYTAAGQAANKLPDAEKMDPSRYSPEIWNLWAYGQHPPPKDLSRVNFTLVDAKSPMELMRLGQWFKGPMQDSYYNPLYSMWDTFADPHATDTTSGNSVPDFWKAASGGSESASNGPGTICDSGLWGFCMYATDVSAYTQVESMYHSNEIDKTSKAGCDSASQTSGLVASSASTGMSMAGLALMLAPAFPMNVAAAGVGLLVGGGMGFATGALSNNAKCGAQSKVAGCSVM
jgi:hypothetical protein